MSWLLLLLLILCTALAATDGNNGGSHNRVTATTLAGVTPESSSSSASPSSLVTHPSSLVNRSPHFKSPLNLQRIPLFGPFFQGWLMRIIDHKQRRSAITIVGSFISSSNTNRNVFNNNRHGENEERSKGRSFDQHYVFSAIEDARYGSSIIEIFPSREEVSMKGNETCFEWKAKSLGSMTFSNKECEVDFDFSRRKTLTQSLSSKSSSLLQFDRLRIKTTNRLPWEGLPTVEVDIDTSRSSSSSPSLDHTSTSANQKPTSWFTSLRQWFIKRKWKGFSGPEGWTGIFTSLLPCHYFIHSVGSSANYNITVSLTRRCGDPCGTSSDINVCDDTHSAPVPVRHDLHGTGYAHIEGNHGTFFPQGWIWSQGINTENQASFSLVSGQFTIYPISPPMTTCLHLRHRTGQVTILRTVDLLDQIHYQHCHCIENVSQSNTRIVGKSILKNCQLRLSINVTSLSNRDDDGIHHTNSFPSFHQLHIPTQQGFSNTPGCQETYLAHATIEYWNSYWKDMNKTLPDEVYEFPLTAYEFGGTFIGKNCSNHKIGMYRLKT